MGSVSASHLVIFIASLVVSVGVAGMVVTEVDRVSQSVTEQSAGIGESIQTDVQIISDTSGEADAIYDREENDLVLLVKNTGETELAVDFESIDLLVEGRFIGPENVDVERATDPDDATWPPGSVIEVRVDLDDDFEDGLEGETRASIAVDGNEDAIGFRA